VPLGKVSIKSKIIGNFTMWLKNSADAAKKTFLLQIWNDVFTNMLLIAK
jgi:hypothetical protein